ncbi:MAG: hypothetical protein ABII24_02520 [bacterium]
MNNQTSFLILTAAVVIVLFFVYLLKNKISKRYSVRVYSVRIVSAYILSLWVNSDLVKFNNPLFDVGAPLVILVVIFIITERAMLKTNK